jgi:hypothetical protein
MLVAPATMVATVLKAQHQAAQVLLAVRLLHAVCCLCLPCQRCDMPHFQAGLNWQWLMPDGLHYPAGIRPAASHSDEHQAVAGCWLQQHRKEQWRWKGQCTRLHPFACLPSTLQAAALTWRRLCNASTAEATRLTRISRGGGRWRRSKGDTACAWTGCRETPLRAQASVEWCCRPLSQRCPPSWFAAARGAQQCVTTSLAALELRWRPRVCGVCVAEEMGCVGGRQSHLGHLALCFIFSRHEAKMGPKAPSLYCWPPLLAEQAATSGSRAAAGRGRRAAK